MPLKVQTCLAQACVVPSGTNATDLSDPCHTGPSLEFTDRPFSRPAAALMLATAAI